MKWMFPFNEIVWVWNDKNKEYDTVSLSQEKMS